MVDSLALITGANGGIGLEIVKKFNEKGVETIGVDLFTGSNIYGEYIAGDVSDLECVKLIFSRVLELNPKRLILANVAGITLPDENSIKAWDKTIKSNLFTPFILIEEFIKVIKQLNISGSIVNITSLAAHVGFPSNPSYAASKGGLSAMTKSYANILGSLNVTVNAVVPGYIETSFNSKSIKDKKAYEKRKSRTILNKWGKPRHIADAVYFITSQEATYITGQDLVVDGGWLAKGL